MEPRAGKDEQSAPPAPGDTSAPELSVVLPVYRNAATLRELQARILAACEVARTTVEIIFVDDGCPAGSGQILAQMAGDDARVRVITHEQNRGQQQAILSGLRVSRGARVLVMDADLQDPPEAIPLLQERLDEHVAAIFAGRDGRYESPGRLLTSRLFKTTLHLLCGVPRNAGAFVLMKRTMVERILSLHAPRPFLVAMIGCSGLPTEVVTVPRSARPEGESAYSGGMRLQVALSALFWTVRWKTVDAAGK